MKRYHGTMALYIFGVGASNGARFVPAAPQADTRTKAPAMSRSTAVKPRSSTLRSKSFTSKTKGGADNKSTRHGAVRKITQSVAPHEAPRHDTVREVPRHNAAHEALPHDTAREAPRHDTDNKAVRGALHNLVYGGEFAASMHSANPVMPFAALHEYDEAQALLIRLIEHPPRYLTNAVSG